MGKVLVRISNKDLNNFEDFIVAWNLCKKHNSMINATELDYFKATQTCKACKKINKKLRNNALDLWRKLLTAYSKKQNAN